MVDFNQRNICFFLFILIYFTSINASIFVSIRKFNSFSWRKLSHCLFVPLVTICSIDTFILDAKADNINISPIPVSTFSSNNNNNNNKNYYDDDEDIENTSEIENLRLLRKPPSAFKAFFSQNQYDLENLGEMPVVPIGDDMEDLNESEDRILTLKAYLDEAERDLFRQNWVKLIAYLNIFTEQENAFENLINGLFPSDSPIDKTGREELRLEAQTMFLAIDDLREAAKDHQFELARPIYAKLLLAYDRFLKAGNLYPSYDVITSTEVLFEKTPRSTLRFDTSSKPKILDRVVLKYGPDMGKTGVIIDETNNMAVVKFDKDQNFYQEVKEVELIMLAKSLK